MSQNIHAKIETLPLSLASEVKAIIEVQWGRKIDDIDDISVEQLYERRVIDNHVSYRSTDMYVLGVKFYYDREPRRKRFSLATT